MFISQDRERSPDVQIRGTCGYTEGEFMKFATFVTQIQEDKSIILPQEVRQKLRLESGDRVEVSIKKIKSGRLDLILSENPLYQLIGLAGKLQKSESE